MKKGWIIVMAVLASYSTQAQFEIPPYPMEITCEVGFTSELDPPPIYSNCHDTNVNVEVAEEMVSGGGCAGKMMITYFFKDTCENEATAQVFVTLKDTQGHPQRHARTRVLRTAGRYPTKTWRASSLCRYHGCLRQFRPGLSRKILRETSGRYSHPHLDLHRCLRQHCHTHAAHPIAVLR